MLNPKVFVCYEIRMLLFLQSLFGSGMMSDGFQETEESSSNQSTLLTFCSFGLAAVWYDKFYAPSDFAIK